MNKGVWLPGYSWANLKVNFAHEKGVTYSTMLVSGGHISLSRK
jgi:hypothetical protein